MRLEKYEILCSLHKIAHHFLQIWGSFEINDMRGWKWSKFEGKYGNTGCAVLMRLTTFLSFCPWIPALAFKFIDEEANFLLNLLGWLKAIWFALSEKRTLVVSPRQVKNYLQGQNFCPALTFLSIAASATYASVINDIASMIIRYLQNIDVMWQMQKQHPSLGFCKMCKYAPVPAIFTWQETLKIWRWHGIHIWNFLN